MAKAWRNDITGLRALAVVPVLLFHSFPSSVPNGFLGVDIFFVISGYLISGIIFRGLKRGDFSWTEFYAKRVKRIIPNLLAVLLFVAVLGWFFLTASEYVQLGKAIFGSAFFFENLRLLSQIGYFDPSSIYKPLIHVWSLCIEEQFYIFFPLVCMFIWKFRSKQNLLGLLILILTICSLTGYLLAEDRGFAFYFPLTRFWELSFGICFSWITVFMGVEKFPRGANVLSVIGFFGVLSSFFCLDSEIVSRGIVNVACVFFSALLLFCGRDALINRTVLSCRPFIFTGLISYSLYLWSWPMNSFQVIIYPEGGVAVKIGVLLVAFIVSAFAYKYIENPVRCLKGRKSNIVVVSLLVLLVVAFLSGQVIRKGKGFPERDFNREDKIFDVRFHSLDSKKADSKMVVDGVELRTVYDDRPVDILVVGDSHAIQYEGRFVKLAKETGSNVAFLTVGGCFVVPGVEIPNLSACSEAGSRLEKLIESKQIRKVVFSQIWGEWLNTKHYRYGIYKDGVKVPFANGGFEIAIDRITKMVESNRSKEFYFLLDAPWDHGTYDIRNHVSRISFNGAKRDSYVVDYPSLDWWRQGNDVVEERFSKLANVIRVESFVCPEGKCDLMKYMDDDHLLPGYLESDAFWVDGIFNKSGKEDLHPY